MWRLQRHLQVITYLYGCVGFHFLFSTGYRVHWFQNKTAVVSDLRVNILTFDLSVVILKLNLMLKRFIYILSPCEKKTSFSPQPPVRPHKQLIRAPSAGGVDAVTTQKKNNFYFLL